MASLITLIWWVMSYRLWKRGQREGRSFYLV